MQSQRLEGIGNERPQRGAHIALPRIGLADPVTDAAGLGHAAAQIGERNAAKERVVFITENQKRVSLIGALILVVTLQAAAKCGTGEIICWPDGLPWRQEVPALL